jgi:hypothetical protein
MFRFANCLFVLGALAGCGTSPQALGLTGAPQQPPPQPPADNLIAPPGIPATDNPYSSSVRPTTGGGRYYGY